ncbi:hypothetical protein ACHAWX_002555 [Stephanocyclus meneghinianus]
MTHSPARRSNIEVLLFLTAAACRTSSAWGGNNGNSQVDPSIFYQNGSYDWLGGATNIAIKVEGCVWTTTDDNEAVGCMQDGSGDGTTYWYQMAMCRRAQVAYSVYATDSGSSSCNANNFKGTFVTQDGLAEFAYIMSQYQQNSPFDKNSYGDLPYCEAGNNGYYLSVGCDTDGYFTIDNFSDAYCLERVSTYDSLSDINYIIKKNLQSCYDVYSSRYDQYVKYSTAGALLSSSKACTSLDAALCVSTERIDKYSGTSKASGLQTASKAISNFNIANKAKYAMGTLCLIGSLFMFLGILFTNRRKRRAMMHRKLRAAKRERARRSGSKGRSSASSRHASASRSRSRGNTSGGRSRSRARPSKEDDESGTYA